MPCIALYTTVSNRHIFLCVHCKLFSLLPYWVTICSDFWSAHFHRSLIRVALLLMLIMWSDKFFSNFLYSCLYISSFSFELILLMPLVIRRKVNAYVNALLSHLERSPAAYERFGSWRSFEGKWVVNCSEMQFAGLGCIAKAHINLPTYLKVLQCWNKLRLWFDSWQHPTTQLSLNRHYILMAARYDSTFLGAFSLCFSEILIW